MARAVRTDRITPPILMMILALLGFAAPASAPATPTAAAYAWGTPETVIPGNFQSYAAGPYSAYNGMWGHYLPQNDDLHADSSMRVVPETFPRNTIFSWNVTPDSAWGGVKGYLHLSYGNYDDSPGTITPRRINNISELTVKIDWTYIGDPASGLLSECWLTPVSTPSGEIAKLHEVAFFPKVSNGGATYLASLPAVGGGSFIDSSGVAWNVREGISGGGEPYYIAYRPGYAEFRGALPYKNLFSFLIDTGKITGNEWFNGLAFGVEPYSGSASLKINQFSSSYAGGE